MSKYESDGEPPPLEDMSQVDSDEGVDDADVPDLEDAAPAAAPRAERKADEDTLDVEAPPPPADGDEPTLMDAMLSASAEASKAKKKKKAEERKKEDATFGAGLSAKAMFSAPVVVEDAGDSSDDDDNVGAGGGGMAAAGGGSAASSQVDKAAKKRRKRVYKRARNVKRESKLLAACAKGNMAGVREWVALKPNLNCQAKGSGGQTPLALAAHGGFLEVVQLLLEQDADPNATTKTDKTPLMVAARGGKTAIVSVLLAAGAKTSPTDKSGKTALTYAKAKKRHEIAAMLEERAAAEVDEDSDVEEEIFLTRPDSAPDSGLRLPEVQAAMANAVPQLERTLKGGEWMTPEFMKKLAAKPILARGLTNPRFMAAIGEFQSNPQQAKRKYANDKDVRDFMTAFYSLMGEHFTEMGKKQEEEERRAKEKAAAEAAAAAEKARKAALDNADPEVRQALSDPEIMGLLSDPRMKAVLQDASKPGRLRHWLNDAEMGPKLRMLQRRGFVQFQM